MDSIDVANVKEFKFVKLHATGQSYISALEDETKIILDTVNVENIMLFLKNQLKSFKNERTGVFCRWEYFNSHFNENMIECLNENNVEYFNNRFIDNTIEIFQNKQFQIIVKRLPKSFEIGIKTYTFIGLTESTSHYLDEEQGKIMIARKLISLKKNQ